MAGSSVVCPASGRKSRQSSMASSLSPLSSTSRARIAVVPAYFSRAASRCSCAFSRSSSAIAYSSSRAVFCPAITVMREKAYTAKASAPRSTAADIPAAICIRVRRRRFLSSSKETPRIGANSRSFSTGSFRSRSRSVSALILAARGSWTFTVPSGSDSYTSSLGKLFSDGPSTRRVRIR